MRVAHASVCWLPKDAEFRQRASGEWLEHAAALVRYLQPDDARFVTGADLASFSTCPENSLLSSR